MTKDGVLVVYKPAGMTSHDVILKVRKWLKTKRIGHTGTLDPSVEGVLPLCIGKATKLVEYMQEQPKTYIAEWTAGYATDTEDQSGQIIEKSEQIALNEEEVDSVFRSFIGSYEQTPPMYSAVKIDGKKLYELARKGEVIERPARRVTIYELEILEKHLNLEYPKVRFRVRCSKGTFIRTLCVDIGKKLHVPAHMSHLIRIESAGYTLADAHPLEKIEQAVYDGEWINMIQPLDQALSFFPAVTVPDYLVQKILNGRPILARFPLPEGIHEGEKIRVLSPNGELIAIHQVIKKDEVWSKPEKILPH